MSQVLISSKVVVCTNQPVDTRALVDVSQASRTSLRKTNQSTFESDIVVISLLMELLFDNESHSLSLCVYVVGFNKSSHMYILLS